MYIYIYIYIYIYVYIYIYNFILHKKYIYIILYYIKNCIYINFSYGNKRRKYCFCFCNIKRYKKLKSSLIFLIRMN